MCEGDLCDAGIVSDMEDSLGLSILRVSHNGCLDSGCPPRDCRNAVLLSPETLGLFSTNRASYITPQHRWESVCPCNGTSEQLQKSTDVSEGLCDPKKHFWEETKLLKIRCTLQLHQNGSWKKCQLYFWSGFSSTQKYHFLKLFSLENRCLTLGKVAAAS